jgi:hypothetical protein
VARLFVIRMHFEVIPFSSDSAGRGSSGSPEQTACKA